MEPTRYNTTRVEPPNIVDLDRETEVVVTALSVIKSLTHVAASMGYALPKPSRKALKLTMKLKKMAESPNLLPNIQKNIQQKSFFGLTKAAKKAVGVAGTLSKLGEFENKWIGGTKQLFIPLTFVSAALSIKDLKDKILCRGSLLKKVERPRR